MTTTMGRAYRVGPQMQEAGREKCPECRRLLPLGVKPSECPACTLDTTLDAERQERRASHADELARLGTAPLTRSLAFARIGIDGAVESLGQALTFASDDRAAELRAAVEHLARAKAALERGTRWTPPQSFGAP